MAARRATATWWHKGYAFVRASAARLKTYQSEDLDFPRTLSAEGRLQLLEDKVAYLNFEVSTLRRLVRHLVAASPSSLPSREGTYASFDFQWSNLPEGKSMLSNPEFREQVTRYITEFTQLPAEWFAGKRVLDAGCGLGRYSFGLCKLGARVVAIDQAKGAIEQTRRNCAEFGDRIDVRQGNLLGPLDLAPEFDLVWSFGVLHHTGDTYRAFRSVAQLVKPGGYLFVMLYGEPRLHRGDDYHYYADLEYWRRRIRNKPFSERVEILRQAKGEEDLHGYFDAISPEINDTHAFDELEGWFLEAGFRDLKRTLDHPNHYLIARRGD